MNRDAPSHLFYQTGRRRPRLDYARGVYIWDVDGKRYLDGSSGAMVCNIGHSHPHVLDAMRRRMEKSTFGYRLHFETEPAERLAAKLASLAPPGLDRAFFVSGGSEAVETALKFARQYRVAIGDPGRWKVISRFPAYHGCTLGALGVSGYAPLTAPFAPMLRESPKIPAPTAWADGLDPDSAETGRRYADMLEAAIRAAGPETVLAFIVEPVGGASTGALVPPPGYMRRIREICDAYDVLLIHDEVMCGGGRTGRFFASEHWEGAQPDLIALSKGFGAGYVPLGAMVARGDMVDAVMDAGGFEHGFTYAGNPLACAAGLAVIEAIEAEGMIANAAAKGAALKARLTALKARYPFIGDVRGAGLLLAFETTADRETRAPLPADWDAYERLVDIAFDQGLIVYSRRSRGGIDGDHFLVCPPMIITDAQSDEIMASLVRALDRFADETGLPVSASA